MRNSFRTILSALKSIRPKKACIYTTLIVLSCLSCSYEARFSKTLPNKPDYSNATFVSCNNPENIGYLCITEANAINMTIDFKKCQEQNQLLRQIIGN